MHQDLKYALRTMAQTPGFTAVAILTLALGIGGNTAIFTVIDSMLLRPLPLDNPDRVFQITQANLARGIPSGGPFSLGAYETMRDRNRSFTELSAYCSENFTLTGSLQPEQLTAVRVSPEFLDALHTRPFIGRGFTRAEGEAGGNRVVLISHALWQRRFASDPAIAGKPITLDSDAYTIVGVMPANFPFPYSDIDIWATRLMAFSGLQPFQIQHGAGYLTGIGRLKPGVSQSRAAAELAVLGGQYRSEHPGSPDSDPNSYYEATPLREVFVSSARPTLLVLAGAIGFVLLIACANIASLLMARASARAKEMAVRAALGATRRDLIRQMLVESLLLAFAGGVGGLLLAMWGVAWLAKANLEMMPLFQPVHIDWVALAFTLALSLLTGIAFGLMPAWNASRPDLNAILRDSGWGSTGGGKRHRARSLLVIGQTALSIVLLIGAGLLIESFVRLQSVHSGFDPRHALGMRITLPVSKYPDDSARARFFRAVLARLQNVPGVKSATAGLSLPVTANLYAPVLAEGQPVVPIGERPIAEWNPIMPAYFKTLGIPLIQGRDFTLADDEHAPRVVIIGESMARSYWPGRSPLGHRLTFGRNNPVAEIVGVVGDVRNRGLRSDPVMAFYTPYPQRAFPGMSVALRAAGDPRLLAKTAEAQVLAVDKDLPVTDVETLDQRLSKTLSEPRQTMFLVASFAVVALLLAVIGLYGVMAYAVSQRTGEIGIRQAVGAQRGDILRLILTQGIRLSVGGIVLGAIASLALTRLISGMLYRVSATDPATFAAIAFLFLAVALAASFVPAYRATRVDPLEALRQR